MSRNSFSANFPTARCPAASNTEVMSRLLPFAKPALIVPPYINIPGLFNRQIPISAPGVFLSQPTTATLPSYHCAAPTTSTESAITSLDGSEYRMPEEPIEMASLTPAVWERRPIITCALLDFFTTVANELRCILHGFPSHPALTMPV